MIKKFISAVVLALFASTAMAQSERTVLWQFDIESATETFASLSDVVKQGTVAVTAAASVTLTGTNAFTNVAVGDYIRIFTGSVAYERSVIARDSASSITLSGAAITVTSATFTYRSVASSTTLNSDVGSFPIGKINKGLISFNLEQQVATGGIDIRLVCRPASSSNYVQVWPAQTDTTAAAAYINYTTGTAARKALSISEPYVQCKVGFKVGASDDGDDLTTNTEQFSVFFSKN